MRLVVAALAVVVLAACGGGDSRAVATVPDVRGLTLEDAQSTLLQAGVVHEHLECPIRSEFTVAAQRPAPGTEVELGTRVGLKLEQPHESGEPAPAGGWPECHSAAFD